MPTCARPLFNLDLAFFFLRDALELPESDADPLSFAVMEAEKLLIQIAPKATLHSAEHRLQRFHTDAQRVALRRRVFDELIDKPRLDNDDDICLGHGGARPRSDPLADKVAVIVTGLPASGKSTIASKIADFSGAFIVDSDFAKRKIPEFPNTAGAALVHEESSLITFGSTKPAYQGELNLFEYCISKGFNMVIPKIGDDPRELADLRDGLISGPVERLIAEGHAI